MRAAQNWLWVTSLALVASDFGGREVRAEASIPILVYHRFGPVATELTTIRTETFAQELQWLRDNEVSVLPLLSVVERLRARQAPSDSPAVVLTADDGNKSIYTEMYPLTLRFRVPVTLFVYPSAISNSKSALTWEQISEMTKSGLVDVQSHTYWHPNFNVEKSRLAPAAYEQFVRNQLAESRSRIEIRLGNKVDLLAWPFGIHDRELERLAAQAGYVAAFGIERERVYAGDDMYDLPRFEVTDGDRGARFKALVTGHRALGAAP